MPLCFSNCRALSSISLSVLTSVTNMSGCFNNCRGLTSVSLINLSQVRYLSSCFNTNYDLSSVTLSGLGKVESLSSCFYACSALKSITLSGLSVPTNMSSCFSYCTSLEDLVVDSWGTVITNLANWGISTCTKLTHDSLINLISALYTTATSRTCTIGTTNLAKLTTEEKAVATAKGWNLN